VTEFVLERQGEPDLRFNGELLAEASSRLDESQERWAELYAYRSNGGKLVGRSVGRSVKPGEIDLADCAVFENEVELMQWFGNGRLAKGLYRTMGLESVEDIE